MLITVNYFSSNALLLRELTGLSIAKMGAQFGLQRSAWGGYEKKGEKGSKPNFDTLLSITKYFGITLSELVEIDIRADVQLIQKIKNHLRGEKVQVKVQPSVQLKGVYKNIEDLQTRNLVAEDSPALYFTPSPVFWDSPTEQVNTLTALLVDYDKRIKEMEQKIAELNKSSNKRKLNGRK